MIANLVSLLFLLLNCFGNSESTLYPRESPTRFVTKLDGIWNFRTVPITDQNKGFEEKWFIKPLSKTGPVISMPVPSSFNDITQDSSLRDFIGWAWYDTTFYIDPNWLSADRQVILRFGSVHYYAIVYVNGMKVIDHVGGHLPFEVKIKDYLIAGKSNLLTVAVNNTLDAYTVPPAMLTWPNNSEIYPPNTYLFTSTFDFFNYAGIHRSVHLYSVPATYLQQATVDVSLSDDNQHGLVNYSLTIECEDSEDDEPDITVEIVDHSSNDGKVLATSNGFTGSLSVRNVTPWWPYLMNPKPGYLYSLLVKISSQGKLIDQYDFKIGFRSIKLTKTQLLINDQPFYFTGFGKHEDSNIRGRGLDNVLNVKDFNLIKWIGANSFRTSHYPYSEELMDLADHHGIVVIDECPAVGLESFEPIKLGVHLQFLAELVARDRHRPSVVMWSIANEPKSTLKSADDYFNKVSSSVRKLDQSRPITAAVSVSLDTDEMSKYLDVIMVNRYYSWYSNSGHLEVVKRSLVNEMRRWFRKFQRPIMMSEYGADTIPGLHSSPSRMFTEDYQTEMLMDYHDGFDELRSEGWFIGELIWNFADFMTQQSTTRIYGNRKGIFTRERQPKAAASLLRCRYLSIHKANITDNSMYCPARLHKY